MPDSHPEKFWEIEPHTKAKHEILKRYLDAWFPIMGSWNDTILFVDGFSGPGRYKNGEPGSPRLATISALKHKKRLRDSRIRLLFNEADRERFLELSEWAEGKKDELPSTVELHVRNKYFADLAAEIIAGRKGKKPIPTFAFIDPFGFKDVSLDVIAKLVEDTKSELFILFSYNTINRWVSLESQKHNLQSLFGCDEYVKCDGMNSAERKKFLTDLYERQLKTVCGFQYVSRFEMREKHNRTSYFLYHCTRSLKGLEVMRDAMWAVDEEGGRQFSDKVAGLQPLFEGPVSFDLGKTLCHEFAGQWVSIEQLQKFVLTDTPYALRHLKKPTLKPMQERGEIEVRNQKRKNTFPAGTLIKFRP